MTLLQRLDKTIEAVAVATFAVSSFLVFINVVNRYLVLGFLRDLAKANESLRPFYHSVSDFMGSITVTADEVPGYLLAWIAFLGAYLALRREGHIAFDMLIEALPKAASKWISLFNGVLMGAFLLMLLWQSIRMIHVSGATEIETAEIAQGWFMLIIPIAAVLLLIAMVTRLIETWRNNEAEN